MQSALFNWNLERLTRIGGSAVAVFLALRLTDGFAMGVAVAVVLAMVLDIPWWLYRRSAERGE